jgi:hypothetical protein
VNGSKKPQTTNILNPRTRQQHQYHHLNVSMDMTNGTQQQQAGQPPPAQPPQPTDALTFRQRQSF